MLKKLSISFLLVGLLAHSLWASPVLPSHKAFQLTTTVKQSTLQFNFKIAPGYSLYHNRIYITHDPKFSAYFEPLHAPPPHTTFQDDSKKTYAVYKGNVTFSLPFKAHHSSRLTTTIHYQGCSKVGLCYPPMKQQIQIDTTTKQVVTTDKPHSPQQIQAKPWRTYHALYLMGSFFLLGLLLTFTPCVLPMIPIISSLITRQSDTLTTTKAFLLSLTYVLSMSFTYAAAGLLSGLAGYHLQAALQSPLAISITSLLFLLLALSLFDIYNLQLPGSLQQRLNQLIDKAGGSYLGVALMGILATLVVSPCTSAPLVGALTYINQTGNAFMGGVALFSLGLGMGIPLLIIGTTGGKYLPRTGPWMVFVKKALGILLLAMAIWVLSRILPKPITALLWAGLCFVCAFLLIRYKQIVARIIALLLGTAGLMLTFLGALPLYHHLPKDWRHTQTVMFTPIKTTVDLNQQLKFNQGKWTLLDIYANWCISCQTMKKNVFTDPAVIKALGPFKCLQADVTHYDHADRTLQNLLNITGPPTLIFFQPNGKEAARLVGETEAKTLLKQIQQLT